MSFVNGHKIVFYHEAHEAHEKRNVKSLINFVVFVIFVVNIHLYCGEHSQARG